jgi:hypothetical protein
MVRGRRLCYRRRGPWPAAALWFPTRFRRQLTDIQPSLLAIYVLLGWPVVVWVLYQRLDPGRALIWSILGGYLILPPLLRLDLPVVPDLDKDTLPALSALVVTALMLRRRLSIWPDAWQGRAMVAMFLVSPFFTVLTNRDPVVAGAVYIPGMQIYDSIAAVANTLLYALPLFLARRDLAAPQALKALLAALVAGGLAYSLPMLLEVRLSPQLNVWFYGYFQHEFAQTMRFGGYRPFVFLPHGLWVAFFAMICLAAATVFLRDGPAEARPRQLAIFLWLALMLVLCKSFGPLAYALVLVPLLLLAPARLQALAAALAMAVVMAYPLLRGAHLVPVDALVDFFRGLSGDRAYSLAFRFQNEDQLLARAAEKPLFGWGGYARNLLHDPVTAKALTIPDGAWIIQIGTYGWLGYIAQFGILALPVWLLAREALARGGQGVSRHAAGLALILAFNMVDLLPNATLVPVTWMIAGAILGHAEALRHARKQDEANVLAARAAARPPRTVI